MGTLKSYNDHIMGPVKSYKVHIMGLTSINIPYYGTYIHYQFHNMALCMNSTGPYYGLCMISKSFKPGSFQ